MSGARAGEANNVGEHHVGCDDEIAAHKNAKRGDKGFKLLMLAARAAGLEHFTVGVDDTPCTENPKFIPHKAMPVFSHTGSTAALCSELGTGEFEKFIASR